MANPNLARTTPAQRARITAGLRASSQRRRPGPWAAQRKAAIRAELQTAMHTKNEQEPRA